MIALRLSVTREVVVSCLLPPAQASYASAAASLFTKRVVPKLFLNFVFWRTSHESPVVVSRTCPAENNLFFHTNSESHFVSSNLLLVMEQ